MRIAYLVNRYPAVSHSFIRREIKELEALGAEVVRATIRPAAEDLPDEQDRDERARTTVILDQGWATLGLAALISLVRQPLRALQTLALALRMARLDLRRSLRHLVYFAEAAWLARHLSQREVDHLHAHFGTNPAAVARLASRLSGIPYSFTAHGPEEFDSALELDLPGKIADARLVVGISSFGRSQLMRWSSPADWHKILIVRCGVDDLFLEAPRTRPPERGKLCCVARLSVQKGLPLLIQASAMLKARGSLFELTLIGDGELRRQLESQVAELGLQECVVFVGACAAHEVRAHIEASRVLVLPSFAEGLPVVLMEALALGRPVISTRIAGIPELVDDRCGWLVPAGSAEALADAMAAALALPVERLADLGAAGKERVAAMHDAGRNASELLSRIQGAVMDRST